MDRSGRQTKKKAVVHEKVSIISYICENVTQLFNRFKKFSQAEKLLICRLDKMHSSGHNPIASEGSSHAVREYA